MHDHSKLLRPEHPRKPWHLFIIVFGELLEGGFVGMFFSMLVIALFPGRQGFWRTVLFVVSAAVLGYAMVWARLLDLARRDQASRRGESLVDVPHRF